MSFQATMSRWHRLLALLVGVPILLWTITGFIMSARPISEVRGDDLVGPTPAATLTAAPLLPAIAGLPVESLALEQRAGGAVWIARIKGRPAPRLADPATGAWLPDFNAAAASREVLSRYTGKSRIASVSRVIDGNKVIELRRPFEGWRVRLDDGTNFFVEAGSGRIVAHRSSYWRFYDFLWGLHIMDLQGRSDPHNPWIVMLSALSLVVVVLGLAMLPGAFRRRPAVSPRTTPRAGPASRD